MASVSSMILRSLRLIGEKSVGGTLNSDEQAAYLDDLNSMMASWSLERLMCYQITQENFSLSSSVGSYTIGSGGTFDTTRPSRIVDPCFIRDGSGYDSPLQLIDAAAYGLIVEKTLDGAYPAYLFYDQGYSASGLGTIYLYPEPDAGLTLYINSWKALQTFAAVSTALALPPGYQRAIEFNFAVEVAGGFTQVPPEVAMIARQSKAAIKNVNAPAAHMQLDLGVAGTATPNILTGP